MADNIKLTNDQKLAKEQADDAFKKYLLVINSIRQQGFTYIPQIKNFDGFDGNAEFIDSQLIRINIENKR
jgi:hypothetical protein